MHFVSLLLVTCLSIVGFVSAAMPACQVCQKYEEWVGTACSGDGVCGPANSKCYKGKCLCDFGYIYSVGRRACVDSCAKGDLQDSYLKYTGGSITGNNLPYQVSSSTADPCKARCSQDDTCLSTEIGHTFSTNNCNFHAVEPSASNWDGVDSTWDFYQRNCA